MDQIVSALVVTYNGSDCIGDCIQSLIESVLPVNIIVVDNCSDDNTTSIANSFENVTLISNSKNLGFGRANNLGIYYALKMGADYVFLLNQDASIHRDSIERLLCQAKRNKNFGILSPFQLNGDGSEIDPNFFNQMVKNTPCFYSDLFINKIKNIYSTNFVNAAAWLISRDCLLQIGGFDPIFFMYGEDKDYCNRAIFHGYDIGIVPSSVIFHGRTSSAIYKRSGNIIMRSNLISASLLPNLKHPSGTFPRRFIATNIDIIFKVFNILFVKRNLRDLFDLIITIIRLSVQLPKIHSHRKLARTKGTHWINLC